MDITKIDAAKAQLATAIRLYFDDRDPISVHTLTTAAGEIVDKICEGKGLVSMRNGLLDNIPPPRRREVADALNRARNFFKHASSTKPDETLRDFSDDTNLFTIIFVADGLRMLGSEIPESQTFGAWVSVVEPELILAPPSEQSLALIFGDIRNQPRRNQKKVGRDALFFAATGKLPEA
jgi:hypothetical protein